MVNDTSLTSKVVMASQFAHFSRSDEIGRQVRRAGNRNWSNRFEAQNEGFLKPSRQRRAAVRYLKPTAVALGDRNRQLKLVLLKP